MSQTYEKLIKKKIGGVTESIKLEYKINIFKKADLLVFYSSLLLDL